MQMYRSITIIVIKPTKMDVTMMNHWPVLAVSPFAYSKHILMLLAGSLFWHSSLAAISLTAADQQFQMEYETPANKPIDSIAVELDGYDVSQLVIFADNKVTVKLETPLAPGPHSVSVVAFFSDGEIETLVSETVDVFASQGIKTSSWNHNVLLSSEYRAAQGDDEDFQFSPHTTSRGAANLNGEVSTDKWELSFNADVLYDSISENNPNQDEFELPYYQLAAKTFTDFGTMSAELGNIIINQNNLLFSNYQRRGAKAGISDESERYSFSYFQVHSEASTNYRNDLGLPSNSEEESSGAIVSMAPLKNDPQKLIIGAGYIEGESTLGNQAVSGLDLVTRFGGDAWNAMIDSYWLNNSVWVHLEKAESDFDSDGLGEDQGEDGKDANASQAILQLSSDGDLQVDWLDQWSAGYQHKSIDYRYFSLGNLDLPGNKALDRTFISLVKSGLTVDLEVARESTVDTDIVIEGTTYVIPDQSTRRKGINTFYVPAIDNLETGLWSFLGAPSFGGYFYRTQQSQPLEDSVIYGYDLENVTYESSLSASFSHETWSWTIQHNINRMNDFAEGDFAINDTKNKFTIVQFNFTPNDRFYISPTLQINQLDELDVNSDSENIDLGIDTSIVIIPDELTFALNYTNSKSTVRSFSENVFDATYDVGSLRLDWKALKPQGLSPGVNTYIKGSYQKQTEDAFNLEDKIWQIQIGIDLVWAKGV